MDDVDAIVITEGQRIPADNVFMIMIFDIYQVVRFAGGVFRKLVADLDVYTLVPSYGNEVNFFGCLLSYVDVVSPAEQFQIHDVFKKGRDHLAIKAHLAVL